MRKLVILLSLQLFPLSIYADSIIFSNSALFYTINNKDRDSNYNRDREIVELDYHLENSHLLDRLVVDLKNSASFIKDRFIEKPLEAILPEGLEVEVAPNFNRAEILFKVSF